MTLGNMNFTLPRALFGPGFCRMLPLTLKAGARDVGRADRIHKAANFLFASRTVSLRLDIVVSRRTDHNDRHAITLITSCQSPPDAKCCYRDGCEFSGSGP